MNYDDLVGRLFGIGHSLVDSGNKDVAAVVYDAAQAIQELQRDALRYRWLRKYWDGHLTIYRRDGRGVEAIHGPLEETEYPETVDAAIDEAMQHDPA